MFETILILIQINSPCVIWILMFMNFYFTKSFKNIIKFFTKKPIFPLYIVHNFLMCGYECH